MTLPDTKALREKAVAALAESESDWQYIDGPLVGDVCVETRPNNPGRSRIRFDPNSALGPFVAATSPSVVLALLDRIASLEDAFEIVSRIADRRQEKLANKTIERDFCAAMMDRQSAIARDLKQQLQATTAARDEACAMIQKLIDAQARYSPAAVATSAEFAAMKREIDKRIAALRAIGRAKP